MADGDARLEAVLEAKIDKLQASLNKANQATGAWAHTTQKHIDDTNSKWEKLFGRFDPGKSLDRLFDSTRLATLEAGGTRLRLFGSALEPLGALGISAAAGIAAFGLGLDQADKAIKYADNLYKLAKNAHVTTDELQAMKFALSEAGGEGERAAEGLEAFSVKLGTAEAGTKRGLLPFQELFGKTFSRENVKNLGDTGQALIAVTAQIEKLKTPAQKDAIVEQLGLTALKPLIEGGVDKMKEFVAEAQKAGVIMDASLIQRGHELNSTLETLHTKIDVQLKSAFIELGPILVEIVGKIADMAKFAADAADHLAKLQDRRTSTLVSERAELVEKVNDPAHRFFGGGGGAQARIAAIDAELAQRAAHPPGPPPLPTGNGSLHDPTTRKGAPDKTDELTKTAEEDQQRALKGLAEAYKNLTANVQDRAKFEVEANNAEAAAEQAKLKGDLDRLLKDETIDGKTSDILQAKIEEAQADVEKARVAKNDLVQRTARYAAEAKDDDTRKQLADAEIAQLTLALDLATTQAERNRIEREILAIKQDEARHAKATELSNLQETGAITDEEGDKRFSAFLGSQKTERQQLSLSQEDPIQRYTRSIQDLDTAFKNADVEAARSAAAGLADAIVNAKDLGDVASSVFKQLIQQVLEAVIQKDITGPLLALIPGFADGTDFAPGGVALVGERGPELVDLPIGSRVISNKALGAISNMPASPRAGQTTVIQTFTLDNRGGVTTQDLIDQINQMGTRAALAGAQLGKKDTLNTIRQSSANRLGRR